MTENNEVNSEQNSPALPENKSPIVVNLPNEQQLIVGEIDPGLVIEVATWVGTDLPNEETNRFMLGVTKNQDGEEPSQRAISYQETPTSTGLKRSNLFVPATIDQSSAPVQSRSRTSKIKIAVISIVSIIVSTVLLIGAFSFLGLSFVHPNSGPKSSMGAMESNLVLVRKTNNYVVGDTVVTNFNIKKLTPNYGVISVADNGQYMITSTVGYYKISKKDIIGKSVTVLPFLGYIAKLIK